MPCPTALVIDSLLDLDGDANPAPAVLDRVLDRLHAAVVDRGLELGRMPPDSGGLDGEPWDAAESDVVEGGRETPLAQHGG